MSFPFASGRSSFGGPRPTAQTPPQPLPGGPTGAVSAPDRTTSVLYTATTIFDPTTPILDATARSLVFATRIRTSSPALPPVDQHQSGSTIRSTLLSPFPITRRPMLAATVPVQSGPPNAFLDNSQRTTQYPAMARYTATSSSSVMHQGIATSRRVRVKEEENPASGPYAAMEREVASGENKNDATLMLPGGGFDLQRLAVPQNDTQYLRAGIERVAAKRQLILSRAGEGALTKDSALCDLYAARSLHLHPSLIAAELRALDAADCEALGTPRAQLMLLENRPGLLTAELFGRVYSRILDWHNPGTLRQQYIDRLHALNPAFPNNATLAVMRSASHSSDLMEADVAAAWVRQLFIRHANVLSDALVNEEFHELRRERRSPLWIPAALQLYVAFPDRFGTGERAHLVNSIDAESGFSEAEKRAMKDQMAIAISARQSPLTD